jgi:S-DNA-T family DNA segregation ATPase FtsK/SpoIIIE
VGFRDITGYNAPSTVASCRERGVLGSMRGTGVHQRLPFILVVVDELADLMMVAARDVEESINRIAQKARAVGIHLVIATQRPSVNVITGVIKANIPARFAFAVSSATDSKVILEPAGRRAPRRQGRHAAARSGVPVGAAHPGLWVEEKEVQAVVGHLARPDPDEVHYVEEVVG